MGSNGFYGKRIGKASIWGGQGSGRRSDDADYITRLQHLS